MKRTIGWSRLAVAVLVTIGVAPLRVVAEERAAVEIDHLVLGAPDVEAEAERLKGALGVRPTAGGSHPDRGTANALMSLGGRAYLEVIGPDPELETLPEMGQRLSELEAVELLTFAVASDELAKIDRAAKDLGLRTSGVRRGSRKTPDGELLKWRTLGVAPGDYGGLVPFFIDWGETRHPSETAAGGARISRMVVAHPEPEGLREIYRALGVDVEVRYGNRAAIVVEIERGEQRVLLTGSGSGLR